MHHKQYWQNFELGKEVEIGASFIYDGLRNFHEMKTLELETEVFQVLYNLSVGLERLLKVAVVLLEYNEGMDSEEFEKSLITHNHFSLIDRVRAHVEFQLSGVQNELVALLSSFYKTFRYDRYRVATVRDLSKEKKGFRAWIEKHLSIPASTPDRFLSSEDNSWRVKKFVGRHVSKIVLPLYEVIRGAARSKNVYTDEIRYYSKAYKLIYGKEFDFLSEDILWRELLIFILNGDEDSPLKKFLGEMEPLNFDVALLPEYLRCFSNNLKRIEIADEMHTLYEDLEEKRSRIEILQLIDNPHVEFPE